MGVCRIVVRPGLRGRRTRPRALWIQGPRYGLRARVLTGMHSRPAHNDAMTLPTGFYWAPRWQYDRGANAIYLDGWMVAWLDLKADGATWQARLDVQRGIDAPLVLRECSSYEAGRRGCEQWVHRHEARLRAEVEAAAGHRSANKRMF